MRGGPGSNSPGLSLALIHVRRRSEILRSWTSDSRLSPRLNFRFCVFSETGLPLLRVLTEQPRRRQAVCDSLRG